MTQNIYDDAFSVSYARLDLEQLALPPSAKVYNRTASGCFPSSTRSSWRSSPPPGGRAGTADAVAGGMQPALATGPFKQFTRQLVDIGAHGQHFQPARRNCLRAIIRAGKLADDGAGRIGIFAQVDGAQHGLFQ